MLTNTRRCPRPLKAQKRNTAALGCLAAFGALVVGASAPCLPAARADDLPGSASERRQAAVERRKELLAQA